MLISLAVLVIAAWSSASATIHMPAEYPRLPQVPLIIPAPYRNYFSLDGDTQGLIRSIAGPGLLPENLFDHPMFQTTPAPQWTRPTTPKDELISYFERTFDRWLSGGYQPRQPLPTIESNAIEEDSLLFSSDDKTFTKHKNNDDKNTDENVVDGSGAEPDEAQHEKNYSSIAGIPKVYPNISKVPVDFGELIASSRLASADNETSIMRKLGFNSRPNVPEGGLGPLVHGAEIRRHPSKSQHQKEKETYMPTKTVEQFQYGAKPTYKQGVMSSVLDFLGLPQIGEQTSELDRAITSWLLHHSPTYTTRAERLSNIPSGYNSFQKFISQSMLPLCTPQPESVTDFDVHAFMGQWFQVMHSPLMSSSSCSIMSYQLLTDMPNGIGAVFQTLEYSVPRLDEIRQSGDLRAVMTSGDAVVTRPGQLIFRKSNSPEDAIVHVIHVSPVISGRYEYAVLSINCNYPLYVIARDPDVFAQRYAETVNTYLQRHGFISKLSRFLNIVKPVDFSQCRLPPTFFDTK